MRLFIVFFLTMAVVFATKGRAQKRAFSFRYENFYRTEGLQFMGHAQASGGTAHLVEAENFQAGSFWYSQGMLPIAEEFSSSFAFRLSQPCECKGGADGLAMVFHTNSRAAQLGKNAQGLGYEGIPRSLALEFDAFDNREGSDHHVSLHSRKSGANSAATEASIAFNHGLPQLKDGKLHTVKVDYIRGRLKVYFDEMTSPVLDVYIDLETYLNAKDGKAWMGFTAATGGGKALHEITYWTFEGRGNKKPRKEPFPKKEREIVAELPKPRPVPEALPLLEEPTPRDKIITQLEEREVKKPTRTIYVSSPNLTISLWDNNRRDGDIVSVNLNGEWIVDGLKLKKREKEFFVRLSEENNQLILHAHNLGKYPPNTASMAINDGKKRRILSMSSNLDSSESVMIRYKPGP